MTRAAVCGTAFDDAVAVLGLERVDDTPDVVLLDLCDAGAIARATRFDVAIPRVVLGHADQEELLRALGIPLPVATSAAPAVIGPLVAAALPPPVRRATRTILITGLRGGVGRTLLAVGLATRLATRSSVVLLDVTGTGAAAWWLGVNGGSWSDLEGLADELTSEHLAVVAAGSGPDPGRLRLVGGAPSMPTAALAVSATRAALALADVVILDAPAVNDERTVALRELADRVLLVVSDDAVTSAQLEAVTGGSSTWVLASRSRAERVGGHAVLRALPDDASAIRSAARGPSRVCGDLGRAYDDLAELIAIDIG